MAFPDDYLNAAPTQMPVSPVDFQVPDVPQRRSIGNVLSDFFSAEQQAQRRPLSNALGNVGDFLSSIAQISRGETPTMLHRQLYNANTDRMQQQAEIDRQNQARNAFAQILQNANPQIANLAKFDPQTAYQIQQDQAAAQAAAQKPGFVGNTVIPRTAAGGYDYAHAFDLGTDWTPTTQGDQPGIFNKRTGQFIPQGNPKAPEITYHTIPSTGQLVATQGGKVVNTIGPEKAGKTPPTKTDQFSGYNSTVGALASLDKSLEDLTNDPNLSGATGLIGGRLDLTRGQREVNGRLDALEGQAIPAAIATIKSSGGASPRAVSEIMGEVKGLVGPIRSRHQATEDYLASVNAARQRLHDRINSLTQEAVRQGYAVQNPDGTVSAATGNAPAPSLGVPPREAIMALRKSPDTKTRSQFDEVFGAGAAARALGGK